MQRWIKWKPFFFLEANVKLQNELKAVTEIIEDLQTSDTGLEGELNNLEQYNRWCSVQISNVSLTSDEVPAHLDRSSGDR
jgi:hypothetical protein